MTDPSDLSNEDLQKEHARKLVTLCPAEDTALGKNM